MKNTMLTVAVAALAAGSLTAAPAPAQTAAKPAAVKPVAAATDIWGFLPPVVAEMNGKKITKAEFITFFMAQMPEGKLPPMITADMLKQAAPQLVKSYVSRELMLDAAAKAGFKPSKALAEASMRRQMKEASPEELEMFKRQLAMNKKTLDSFIADEASKLSTQQNAAVGDYLEKNVISKVTVPEAEALKFYNANKNSFKVPGDAANTVRASHILILSKKDDKPEDQKAALAKIEKIAAELKKNPKKFEELAVAESGCPSGKMNKGSLGSFGKGQMVPEFEKAAFELKDGQISGIVKTSFGYHIIRRDVAVQERIKPFAEVKTEIMTMLKSSEINKKVESMVAELEKQANVKIFVKEAPVAPATMAPAKPAPKR